MQREREAFSGSESIVCAQRGLSAVASARLPDIFRRATVSACVCARARLFVAIKTSEWRACSSVEGRAVVYVSCTNTPDKIDINKNTDKIDRNSQAHSQLHVENRTEITTWTDTGNGMPLAR